MTRPGSYPFSTFVCSSAPVVPVTQSRRRPRFCSLGMSHTEVGLPIYHRSLKASCPRTLSDTSPTTMVTPSKPTIYVAPATEDDYDQLVEWKHTVLERNDSALDHVFAYPERAAEDISRTREMFTDPSSNTFKVVLVRGEGEGDPMVGYVTIKMQGENWIEENSVEEAKKGAQ